MSSSLPGVNAAQGVVKMEPIEIDDSATASTKTLPVGSLPSPDEYATDFHYTQALAKKQTRKRWALILLAALAITLVIVVPSTVFGTRRQAARKTKLSSLVSFLEDSGMAVDADADQDSPQSKAARWLASEDPANLPLPTEEHEKYRYLVRYVMTVLYYSMNGEGWARDSANFLNGDDICFWHHPSLFEGVYCTKFSIDPNRTPILLYLNSMKLSGKIPSEIGQLSLLRTVSMQANNINGAIPTEVCKMSSLEALALNSNAISGTVPSCLNENAKLRELYFTYNNIRGNVPQQLCSLSNLQVVSTGFNKLSGSLPSCLGNLPRLKQLRIQQNDLSGSLPTSLCKIESLDLLSLGWNSMTGTIPTCFGGMSALQRLYLHTNEFRGTIPEELCDTKHLSVFDAGFNVLTGTIPACLGTRDLTLLSLGENSLTGSIPPELADATDLGVLLVDDNLLSGDPTSTLTKLTNLKQLYVNGNNFEGEINDSFLKNSTLLDFADFSDNQFTSPDGFPQHLIELRTLNVLDFSNNLLAGRLPDDFSPSGVLNVLSLFNNQLTGTFPRMIRRLSNLLHLDVSNNLFTGELPSDIGEMSMLEVLFLSKNRFDAGTIPSSFSGLQRLKELSLRGTNRTGALPHFISGYNSLDLLDLGSNGLTGTIPSSYSELGSLTYFLLNDNDLEGTVPATMSQLTDLRAVYLDGTTLSGDLEQLCTIPIFADNTKTTGERIIADCVDGSIAKEISCSCCLCCTAGTTGGCSEPKLNNLEIMWENSFRRQSHEIDFGGEEATVDVEPSIDIQPE